MERLRSSQRRMTDRDGAPLASLTIDGVRRDAFFRAIDQGLELWIACEKDRRPKSDPAAALCTGSCAALERATDLIRLGARAKEPKVLNVRVTSASLRHVPHGNLRPAQVFYRWASRIADDVDPFRGKVQIDGTTFLVRPVLDSSPYRRERLVGVEVATLSHSGRVRILNYAVDEVVDVSSPLRPNDPERVAASGTEAVRWAQAYDRRLAHMLRSAYEAFGITIKLLLRRLRRKQKPSTLILVRQDGTETVLFARVAGGGTAAITGPTQGAPRAEELTEAARARHLLAELIDQPLDAMREHEQTIYDILDSTPDDAAMRAMIEEYTRLRDAAVSALQVAATELHAIGAVDASWLDREAGRIDARVRELSQDPTAALELSRRHLHARADTVSITRGSAIEDDDSPPKSGAHEGLRGVARVVRGALHRFSRLPEAYWRLTETLATIRAALKLYEGSAE